MAIFIPVQPQNIERCCYGNICNQLRLYTMSGLDPFGKKLYFLILCIKFTIYQWWFKGPANAKAYLAHNLKSRVEIKKN